MVKSQMINQKLIQGTPAWLAMRKEHVTATDAGVIMGFNQWQTIGQLLDYKLGLRPEQEDNDYMKYGRETEPEARRALEEHLGISLYPKVVISPLGARMASLDGISMDGKTVVEIKCPGAKDHAVALKGQVPEKYMPQLQHILAITDAKEIFYWSYRDGSGTLVAIPRDDDYIARLVEKEIAFYAIMVAGQKKIKEHEDFLDELKNKAYGLLDGTGITNELLRVDRRATDEGESLSPQ